MTTIEIDPGPQADIDKLEARLDRFLNGDLGDLDRFPSPDEHPEYDVDFGETGPHVAEIGHSECAT